MMTREEILSIEEYCAEYKISHKKRLEELGVSIRRSVSIRRNAYCKVYKVIPNFDETLSCDEAIAQMRAFLRGNCARYV